MSVFPLILKNEHKGILKDNFFEIGKKLYKVLGFKKNKGKMKVYTVRILRKTLKPSSKQPIFEVYNFSDVL